MTTTLIPGKTASRFAGIKRTTTTITLMITTTTKTRTEIELTALQTRRTTMTRTTNFRKY